MNHTTEIGKEYGYLTVLRELRNKKKRGRYWVRCRCGHILEATKDELLKPDCRCSYCSRRSDKKSDIHVVGEAFKHDLNGSNNKSRKVNARVNTAHFKKNSSNTNEISLSTSVREKTVKPKIKRVPFDGYHFKVIGEYAIGKLSTGIKFIIDASKIDLVNTLQLFLDSKGYLAYWNGEGRKRKLHRLLLGIEGWNGYITDHINRNKLDCRLANLRIVTAQQNAMNRSLSKKRQSCYMGVSYSKTSKVFISVISLANNTITLLKSKNPEKCAAAYNHASLLLFKQFRGHVNNVPEASPELKKEVEAKMPVFVSAL